MIERVGDQLRRVREDRGLSREQLSGAAKAYGGVAAATITKYEHHERSPEDDKLEALGRALRATATEFPAYWLAAARQLLNADVVGLRAALANADHILRLRQETPEDVTAEVARQREATPPLDAPFGQRSQQEGRES